MKAHNPRNFTPEQYGFREGYRLLDEDEICPRRASIEQIESCYHIGEVTSWDKHSKGCHLSLTYRTKLSREELAAIDNREYCEGFNDSIKKLPIVKPDSLEYMDGYKDAQTSKIPLGLKDLYKILD